MGECLHYLQGEPFIMIKSLAWMNSILRFIVIILGRRDTIRAKVIPQRIPAAEVSSLCGLKGLDGFLSSLRAVSRSSSSTCASDIESVIGGLIILVKVGNICMRIPDHRESDRGLMITQGMMSGRKTQIDRNHIF